MAPLRCHPSTARWLAGGEDAECNWGVPEPTRAGGKRKGVREERRKRADSLTSVELAVSVIA